MAIQEHPNEDCKEVVRAFLRSLLSLSDNAVKAILHSRCHRLNKKSNYPRPIISKFVIHSQKMLVRQKNFPLRGSPHLRFSKRNTNQLSGELRFFVVSLIGTERLPPMMLCTVSWGESRKCSRPVCLSVLLFFGYYGLSVRGLWLVTVVSHLVVEKVI